MKRCSKCKKEKSVDEFNKRGVDKDGNPKCRSQCRQCEKEYKLANKEKEREYSRKYREANSERIKKWREDNKDVIAESDKKYRLANAEKIKKNRREYYEKNKSEYSEKSKAYYKKNKEKIKQRTKEYYLLNVDEIRVLKKQYRENNKDRIKAKDKKYHNSLKRKEYETLMNEFCEYVRLNPEYQNYETNTWTYLIKSKGYWKIGVTSQFNMRMRAISAHIPLMEVYRLPINIERRLHLECDKYRFCHNEKWDGYTELFDIDDEYAYEIIKRERFKGVK